MSKSRKDTHDQEPDSPTLQAQMDELAAVVEQLEDPEVPLEESLSLYEKGMTLVKQATSTLEAAEQRVALVTAEGETQALKQ